MCAHTYMCMNVEARQLSLVLFPETPSPHWFVFLRLGLSLAWNSPGRLDWPGKKPQVLSCASHYWHYKYHRHTQHFLSVFWESSSKPNPLRQTLFQWSLCPVPFFSLYSNIMSTFSKLEGEWRTALVHPDTTMEMSRNAHRAAVRSKGVVIHAAWAWFGLRPALRRSTSG